MSNENKHLCAVLLFWLACAGWAWQLYNGAIIRPPRSYYDPSTLTSGTDLAGNDTASR